ncbi:MAG: hypothetical protein AB8G26_10620 [Ilumatobacter sp.]
MPTKTSLPGSNSRIAALCALAAITVGATAVEFEAATPAASASASSAPPLTAAISSTDPAMAMTSTGAESTQATSTSAASPGAADADAGQVESPAPAEQIVPASTTPPPAAEVPTTTEAAPAPTSVVDDASSLVDDFSADMGRWTPMSGVWSVADGQLVQADAAGYDLINQFETTPPAEYSVSVDMTARDGSLGGGILLGQSTRGSRRGATLVDFTDSGRFLRWGVYDAESGRHEYKGGLKTGEGFDLAATHTLTVEVFAGRTRGLLDGHPFGEASAVAPGNVGLVASLSALSFDNFEIVEI